MVVDNDDVKEWVNSIVSLLKGSKTVTVKQLRKQVLLSMQLEPDDKAAKKQFKKTVQHLEHNGRLKLDAEGTIELKSEKGEENKAEKKKKKKKKKEKKSKKRKQDEEETSNKGDSKNKKQKLQTNDKTNQDEDDNKDVPPAPQHEQEDEEEEETQDNKNKGGVTRLFVGNLPFAVDEASLGAFFDGSMTHVKWITDKETGKFYGSAFCEIDTPANATKAVVGKAGQKLMGRPLKVNYAPARPGDVWPPTKDKKTVGGGGGGTGIRAMSEKPDHCVKLFCGNLSYEIDDDTMTKFFANVDAEVKAIRWLHHQDSGDFKGCGFVEFWSSDACEKGATLNGKNLLGRPIRIDWSD